MVLRRMALASALAFSAFAAGCAGSSAPADTGPAEEDDILVDEVRSKSDAELKAEIEAAADGLLYVSEGDYPYTFVSAPLVTGERRRIDEALVRAKLASFVDGDPDADKPLAELHGEVRSFKEWKERYATCGEDEYPGPEECKKMQKLNEVLEKNLWGEKVFYFGRAGEPGHVDGVAVTIFIVGRTPQGNLAGVRTIAIWT